MAGANAPLATVRDACLRARAGVDRDAAHERIRRERFVREYVDAEGAWHLHARGTPDAGARFRAALKPLVDQIYKTPRAEVDREPRDAYAFDALIQLTERTPGNAPTKKSGTFAALIRADLEALQRGYVDGDEICEISGLGPIPVHVARELLGESVLKLVLTKGVDVANVTHLGRGATAAQQVALWWQAPECQALGCNHTQRLENDHRNEWAKRQETRLDNLDPLCDHHHDLKTRFGWALTKGTGKRPMVPPTDPRHPQYRAPPEP